MAGESPGSGVGLGQDALRNLQWGLLLDNLHVLIYALTPDAVCHLLCDA